MNFELLSSNELRKEEDRLEALYLYNILDTDAEDAFDKLAEIAAFICEKPFSLITLTDSKRHWFKAKYGLNLHEVNPDIIFLTHSKHQNDFMEVPDSLNDESIRNSCLVTKAPYIRYYAGVTLKTPGGHKIGTLCVLDTKPGRLSVAQINHLESLARQVEAQMELRKHKNDLQKLNGFLIKELEEKIKQQNRLLNLFTRFVPNEIVAKHLSAANEDFDDAELKNLTVLFCDIRGYTPIIERLAPNQAVSILKLYYNIMSDVITGFSGMVNQYVGDEIFATFGAPFSEKPYELNAVLSAMKMMEKLADLNKSCREFIDEEIKIGIGIHSGPVITGTLGSKEKIEYSVTGDTVNTGKRIESITRETPNTILISFEVYEKVKEFIEVKILNPFVVKGKLAPIRIFEVIGRL